MRDGMGGGGTRQIFNSFSSFFHSGSEHEQSKESLLHTHGKFQLDPSFQQ